MRFKMRGHPDIRLISSGAGVAFVRGGHRETRTRVASCSDHIGAPLYRSHLPTVCGSSALLLSTGDAQRNRADVSELLHPIGSLSFACREESVCAPLADCLHGL